MSPRRIAGVLVFAVTVAGLAVFTFGQSDSDDVVRGAVVLGGPPVPPAPAEIARVEPPHGSRVCPRPQIVIDLRLTDALRRAGAFDPAKVRLALDGRDVTREVRILGTMEYPQGRASMMYAPERPLALGPHQAALTFATPAGPKTYRWTFTVADIPCR